MLEENHKQELNFFLTELTEMNKAENQRISEARDAAILSAEETRILAEKQQVANDRLQSTITQLKTELSASDCKIDELKKKKGVQLSKASTWAATEIQLRNEVAYLKANQTKNETLMKEAKDFREKLERLEKENEDLRTTRAAVLESATRRRQDGKNWLKRK
jgi:FtsZ-binding cell division protein ZapB